MKQIALTINGRHLQVCEGTTVAAAILNDGVISFRRSVSGSGRAPLCGMGICYECTVRIDGEDSFRSCHLLVREGMEIETGDAES